MLASVAPGPVSGGSVLFVGWLEKRGPTISYHWQRRYCILFLSRLEYFVDDSHCNHKGFVTLTPETRAVPFTNRQAPGDAVKHVLEKPFGFVLDVKPSGGPKRRLFYFDAGDSEALELWLAAIGAAAQNLRLARAYTSNMILRVTGRMAEQHVKALDNLNQAMETGVRRLSIDGSWAAGEGTERKYKAKENYILDSDEVTCTRLEVLTRAKELSRILEDAITGNKLNVLEETVDILTDSRADALEGAFEWVPWVYDDTRQLKQQLHDGQSVRLHGKAVPSPSPELEMIDDGTFTIATLRKPCSHQVEIAMPDGTERLLSNTLSRPIQGPNEFPFDIARPIQGVQLPQSIGVITKLDDLVPALLSDACLPPILVNAGPGTGKTFSMIKLLHILSLRLLDDQNVAASKKLPILIPVQQLARLKMDAPSPQSESSNLILDFIDARFDGKQGAVLRSAFEQGDLIVLIDGIDEGRGLQTAIEDLVFKVLVDTHRCVLTTRPEGVQLSRWANICAVVALQPLSQNQQINAITKQIGADNEYFKHLFAFSAIRAGHDNLYLEKFSTKMQQRRIERFSVPDRLMLPAGSSTKFDPEMRQKTLDGERFVRWLPDGAAAKSEALCALDSAFTGGGLVEHVDAIAEPSSKIPKDEIDMQLCSRLKMGSVAHFERAHHIAVKLALLVQSEHEMAASLWPKILRATDESLVVAGFLSVPFRQAMCSLVERAGQSPNGLEIAPQKDPVRLFQKSNFGYGFDYDSPFTDKVPKIACITDILRARIVCESSTGMLTLIELLNDGFEVTIDGEVALLELLRCRSLFDPHLLDPTHFRRMMTNLRITYRGTSMITEVQMHHKDILAFNEERHAHDHYDFFRSVLSDYTTELDVMLENTLATFDACKGNPVLLSMFIVIIKNAGHDIVLPRSKLELYDLAIAAAVRMNFRNLGELEGDAMRAADAEETMRKTLRLIGASNVFSRSHEQRVFTTRDVEETLADAPSSCLALWRRLRSEIEHGVPLIKVLVEATDASGSEAAEFQFKHRSIQEALAARTLIDDKVVRKSFMGDSAAIAKRINSPDFANVIDIGGAALGAALLSARDDWDFTANDFFGRFGVVLGKRLNTFGWHALVTMCPPGAKTNRNIIGISLRELPSLKVSLGDFARFPSLRKLDLYCTNATYGDFGILKHLELLNLYGCFGIEALPPRIGECSSLRQIDMFCTNIYIPDSLADCDALSCVNLPDPDEVYQKEVDVLNRLVEKGCFVKNLNDFTAKTRKQGQFDYQALEKDE